MSNNHHHRTTGSALVPTNNNNSSAAHTHDYDIELGTSARSDALGTACHGVGALSIRQAPTISRGGDTTNYSQTPDSIRDRTMLLSNLALHANKRESVSSSRNDAAVGMGLADSRRSSTDDQASINQILAGTGSGNLSRLLRDRPLPSGPTQHHGASAGLPHLDYSYIGAERVPKNAKPPKSDLNRREPAEQSEDCKPAQIQQPLLPSLHADMHKQHSDAAHLPNEQDFLLSPSRSASDDNYALLQRRGHTLLGLLTMPLQYIPAVILGLIMNLLDALSYGLIAFPVSIPVYAKFGPIGFSMYMLSTAIVQVVLSSGASGFRGANGTMLIEAIPFLHAICSKIIASVGSDQPDRIIATTMASYAISTIITGLVFFLLGFLKIGVLVDFFPRHILVGCIGGVGYFLLETGMEITSQLKLSFSWPALRQFFEPNAFGLWASSFGLAILLRVLCARFTHPMFVPMFFIAVPVGFYAITALLGIDMETLRATGWVFELPDADVPFYYFYTLFDFSNTDWHTVIKTIPTMLGLAFFSILHVPINVPALAVSTNVDKIDTNRELLAHGISNLLSGFMGSLQNYLVYSNSVLFIRSGGGSNLAGMMLFATTLGVFLSGPTIIGYIPNMVVGALIFHLGLELMKESLIDTIGVVNHFEYATIAVIVVAMATIGFNEGIFIGILMACFFFILLYSRRPALRKAYTGSAVRSTVRRLYSQRRFLDDVCKQIQVMRLQGFMFFGTINGVEVYIRNLLEQRQWQVNPIRFLVLDFGLVNGMDFSAAEAFIRIRRLLEAREIYMVICGAERVSEVGRALRAAGVWSDDESEYVQTSLSLNEALEWCENVLLQYYYIHQAALAGTEVPQSYSFVSTPWPNEVHEYGSSPRHAMVSEATQSAMPASHSQTPVAPQPSQLAPAFSLLHQAFLDLDAEQQTDDTLAFIAPYFVHKQLSSDQYLWQSGDNPEAMYVIESGTLRVFVENGVGEYETTESILPGTSLGELSLITNRKHSTTVMSDGDVVLWELSKKVYDELCAKEPAKTLAFVRLALMYPAQGMKAITAYAFCAQ
ncbi:hypothetical protein LPJ78_000648 [Coemansia sp. RSA 989]|nr:hypothetical protein LPJ68_000376 [Coemansia sp. RSA 1086]KAJ1748548.1 hypothetical protein LPJ79_004431 [Coemansia sp. RSA 1821]KAJ1867776.1 hypothetical protein LPJ78_000648 [Coemansia sp. RSA 989]KAJ1870369.1 hypothetical protein LPJ55_004720 [Coemansia sp. RSA 990]KAJ2633735.1 hypothetical protein H4R22_000275 [Coemansia sp. RSA 1290]KAJ2651362.1 hypothetical protein IWW40_001853 [Coemansia sp. RSA 1250]KAJ2673657.1 hypothetical protein IWW42_002069 [Coemansia sp. RSA 1085]